MKVTKTINVENFCNELENCNFQIYTYKNETTKKLQEKYKYNVVICYEDGDFYRGFGFNDEGTAMNFKSKLKETGYSRVVIFG